MSENSDRADRAQLILDYYVRLIYGGDPVGLTSGDLEVAWADPAADMRHLARLKMWDADALTGRAYFHYFAEVVMEEEGWDLGGPDSDQDAHCREVTAGYREKIARLSAP